MTKFKKNDILEFYYSPFEAKVPFPRYYKVESTLYDKYILTEVTYTFKKILPNIKLTVGFVNENFRLNTILTMKCNKESQ